MSLINDALKRANQTPPKLLRDEKSAPPMSPVNPEPRPPVWPYVILPFGLLLILGTASWFIWKGWDATRLDVLRKTREVISAREKEFESARAANPQSAVEPAKSADQPLTATVPSAPPPPVKTNTVIVTNVITIQAEPPKLAFPPLKLQGIFYRSGNPTAMINAKTLAIGDTLLDAQVVAIDRSSVTLVFEGKTNVLTLR